MKVINTLIFLYTFIVLITSYEFANCQSYLGITAGPEWVKFSSNKKNSEVNHAKSKIGYTLGIDYHYLIEDGSASCLAVKYSRINQFLDWNYGHDNINANCKIDYLEIDIFTELSLSKKIPFQFIIGMSPGFLFKAIALKNGYYSMDEDISGYLGKHILKVFTGFKWNKQIAQNWRIGFNLNYFYSIPKIAQVFHPNGLDLSISLLRKLGK
jgi:hypothetical protein